ncbi:glutamate receptor ionotropic, delta-2-like [Procambarus clarkii]|uniref:glutamate receptor ionotropic, delta-2-like n=1 Tax=Procambarus clarkii TaxID=6728 RepID=UPI003742098D
MTFAQRPTFVVAMDERISTTAFMKKDETALGGQRLWFKGPEAEILDWVAKGMNFTYKFVMPADGSTGSMNSDRTWNGVVGMVMRGEAHFATSPFSMTASRTSVVDMTTPLNIIYLTFIAGFGRSEVDPWGFMLPFVPRVWAAIFASLFVMMAATVILYSCPFTTSTKIENWQDEPFNIIKILLQQDFSVARTWLWERVVWGVWLLVNLLLSRSYGGNLISYLAVRYIPRPYPTLQDFLDDPSAKLIWQRDSSTEQYIRLRGFGLTEDLAALEETGRVIRFTLDQFSHSIDTLVRRGGHLILYYDEGVPALLGQDFSKSGRCDFYVLKDKFKPSMTSMMVPKDSPFLHVFNNKVLALREFGLYDYFQSSAIPNFTACLAPPTKISVSTSLSITNLWGIFVVLSGGLFGSLVSLCLEILSKKILQLSDTS